MNPQRGQIESMSPISVWMEAASGLAETLPPYGLTDCLGPHFWGQYMGVDQKVVYMGPTGKTTKMMICPTTLRTGIPNISWSLLGALNIDHPPYQFVFSWRVRVLG